MAGDVTVEGFHGALKPGSLVPEALPINVRELPRYVGRGGLKLEAALEAFGTQVAGVTALDVGASTGGFTDCLLQAGARRVYAVDVGRAQLHHRLRTDARVVVMEGVNAHYSFPLPEPVGLVVMDVSFISVTAVLPNALAHLEPGGTAIVLVKPQFEAGRDQVGKGGIVREPATHRAVMDRVITWARDHGYGPQAWIDSPVTGADGNREFLLLLQPGKPARDLPLPGDAQP